MHLMDNGGRLAQEMLGREAEAAVDSESEFDSEDDKAYLVPDGDEGSHGVDGDACTRALLRSPYSSLESVRLMPIGDAFENGLVRIKPGRVNRAVTLYAFAVLQAPRIPPRHENGSAR